MAGNRNGANKSQGQAKPVISDAEKGIFNDLGNRPAEEVLRSSDNQLEVGKEKLSIDNIVGETKTEGKGDEPDSVVSIPATAFKEILDRLNTLEQKEGQVTREQDSEIFDPLAKVTDGYKARIGFLFNPETSSNDLVLSYKSRRMANGQEKETWVEKDARTGELRTRCSLICQDSNGNIYERTNMDYVEFVEQVEMVECPIVKRFDVGQPVKQEYTVQRVWNGKTLAPTPIRVQTGYIEQKFEYDINVNGKVVHFKQNVVNIK